MKALVIYDSAYGNTEQIARAISAAAEADSRKAADSTPGDIKGVQLLIVGSPTQAGRPTVPVQGWLKALPASSLQGVRVAAFDTRFEKATSSFFLKLVMSVIGFAAPKIAKALDAKGGTRAGEPEGFFVLDNEGPLKDGELERASAWAKGLLS
jgi:flavodoxin